MLKNSSLNFFQFIWSNLFLQFFFTTWFPSPMYLDLPLCEQFSGDFLTLSSKLRPTSPPIDESLPLWPSNYDALWLSHFSSPPPPWEKSESIKLIVCVCEAPNCELNTYLRHAAAAAMKKWARWNLIIKTLASLHEKPFSHPFKMAPLPRSKFFKIAIILPWEHAAEKRMTPSSKLPLLLQWEEERERPFNFIMEQSVLKIWWSHLRLAN